LGSILRAASDPLMSVLVYVADDDLRQEIATILARDGYAIRSTADEAELRCAIRATAARVLVVDVEAVGENTLDDLSLESRVPRIVAFSSTRGEASSRLPFRAEVLLASVSRALGADDLTTPPASERRPRWSVP
jgi:DNA-binding NtrC family response regulator